MIKINAKYCPQNHPCPTVRRCPNNALIQQGYSAPQVIADRCTECGECTAYCRVFQLES